MPRYLPGASKAFENLDAEATPVSPRFISSIAAERRRWEPVASAAGIRLDGAPQDVGDRSQDGARQRIGVPSCPSQLCVR